MEWPRHKTINLIKAIKVRHAIWDVDSIEYRDKYKRRDKLLELAATFDCTKEDIERKISNLRTQYARELAKVSKMKANSKPYESRWFAFKLLSFLKPKKSQICLNCESLPKNAACKIFLIRAEPSSSPSPGPSTSSSNVNRSKASTATKHKDQKKSPEKADSKQPQDAPASDLEGFVQVKLEENEDVSDVNADSNNEGDINMDELELIDNEPTLESLAKAIQGHTHHVVNVPPVVVGASSMAKPSTSSMPDDSKLDHRRDGLDEFNAFGLSVGAQLKGIKDPYARSMAKFNIQKVLFEAEIGKYSGNMKPGSRDLAPDSFWQSCIKMSNGNLCINVEGILGN